MNLQKMIKGNRWLYYVMRDLIGFPYKTEMFFKHKKGLKNNKIVFTSFNGKQYSDNPRAISEKLHEIDPSLELVWLFTTEGMNNKNIPDYVKKVEYSDNHMRNELSNAKIWIDNSFIFAYASNKLYKGKDQLYIQTWHGDRGFKKCGYDWEGFTSDTRGIENGFCDLLLIGSEFERRFFEKAYRYKGDFLESGSPRDDCLINRNSEYERKIRMTLNISQEDNILLYAPTYRDNHDNGGAYNFFDSLNIILNECKKYRRGNWICLYRGHHLASAKIDEQTSCYDVTHYPDMSDLLCISQILITDYSSSAGDFVLKNEPVILFQPDRDIFATNDRQLLFDVDKSPFLIAKNINQLTKIISELSQINIESNCKEILEMYQANENGNASGIVAEKILRFIYKKGEK